MNETRQQFEKRMEALRSVGGMEEMIARFTFAYEMANNPEFVRKVRENIARKFAK